ncbi:MAG: indolepyruvate ferredoxin oxidoreductase [Candidatus Wallbacteria bacterium HGW-Wallbacteria-1]|jgi:indolepyruvate ferredoxin oxidoreductase alpha subunit|uniref:Indolepyruvate oxidoreductase subunit IorA n=1 Tax=Candidatus Wallbacteria bacterium HGW-Wallbacteria-1 TaxID=2013854 RepID=A0A2N1PMS7_9BACT|nr:MAG: indolepyruvate ferredoxin oxidoreductase [Candidatus Wallbacteria bacterium HGW-Wallbacteria-1]
MKSLSDILLNPAGGHEIVMGNTAVVRAMIEAGVRVVTSYPGSPTPEIATAIGSIQEAERPMYFQFSTNEKVATEVAFGASVNGRLSTVFFKSVGLNVAADTFVQLGLMELIGGMVIILGDDPGANSSQNEQDNRHIAAMSYVPILEPASPGEAYTMFLHAARISRELTMPVILRMTTHVCHAKEKVRFAPFLPHKFDDTPLFDPEAGPYIPITSKVFPLKRRALEKVSAFTDMVTRQNLHRIITKGSKPSRLGIITAGMPFLSLQEALGDSEKIPDILKLATPWPLPEKTIIEFLADHSEVLILEELDNFIEIRVKAMAMESGKNTRIHGKKTIDHWIGEYTTGKVVEIIREIWPDLLSGKNSCAADPSSLPSSFPTPPPRPAQMCPGCGHRSAFHAIRKALDDNDITVGDIGCHTMGFMKPYSMGQIVLCMGHSTGTAAGLSLFNDSRKVLAFLGDSTFFHAGIPGIVNAVFNNHRFTLVIMENGTTAMTGHQDHPGCGRNFRESVDAIPIKQVLEGLGVRSIAQVDTYNQTQLTEAVRNAMNFDGFAVVIAKHPCMLKFTRAALRAGKPRSAPMKILDKCDLRKICLKGFACPSFVLRANGKIGVNPNLCIGDGSCRQVCPREAIISSRDHTRNTNGEDMK